MESTSRCNSLIGYPFNRRCCSTVWHKYILSKTGFDRQEEISRLLHCNEYPIYVFQGKGGGFTPPAPTSFYSSLLNRYLKTTCTVLLHVRYLIHGLCILQNRSISQLVLRVYRIFGGIYRDFATNLAVCTLCTGFQLAVFLSLFLNGLNINISTR